MKKMTSSKNQPRTLATRDLRAATGGTMQSVMETWACGAPGMCMTIDGEVVGSGSYITVRR